MRVAVVSESALTRTNGVTNSVRHVVSGLRNLGHECLIVGPGPDSWRISPHGSEVRIPARRLPGLPEVDVAIGRVTPLARILATFQPDVIHLASPFLLGTRAAMAAHELGIPTIAVFQTDVAGFARHYRLSHLRAFADAIIRQVHRRATLTLSPSQAATHYLESLGIRRIRTWSRGVDHNLFRPQARNPSLHLTWGRGRPVVGYVGRLAAEKQVHMMRALSQRSDITVVIIGDGPERASLARAMPRAAFVGRLEGRGLATAIATLDVLVAPGEHETFCQVIQEAMASGVPVVAPAVGGPLDLINDAITGYLYPPGDGASMEIIVDRLLSNPNGRERIVRNALLSVAGRSWTALVRQLIEHYQEARDVQTSDLRRAKVAA